MTKDAQVSKEADSGSYQCPVCRTGQLVIPNLTNPKKPVVSPWLCSRRPDCLYSTRDVGGRPLGKFSCGRCGRQLKYIDTLNEPYWACEGYYAKQACKTTYEDADGTPNYGG